MGWVTYMHNGSCAWVGSIKFDPCPTLHSWRACMHWGDSMMCDTPAALLYDSRIKGFWAAITVMWNFPRRTALSLMAGRKHADRPIPSLRNDSANNNLGLRQILYFFKICWKMLIIVLKLFPGVHILSGHSIHAYQWYHVRTIYKLPFKNGKQNVTYKWKTSTNCKNVLQNLVTHTLEHILKRFFFLVCVQCAIMYMHCDSGLGVYRVHIYTLCLKKVPTYKLSVTLSNLNQFS